MSLLERKGFMKIYEEHYGKIYTHNWIFQNLLDGYFVCKCITYSKFSSERELEIISVFDSEREQKAFVTEGIKELYGDELYLCESNKECLKNRKFVVRRGLRVVV